MEMMTITSRDGITDEREPLPDDGTDCSGIFPDAIQDPSKRPYRFNK